MPKAKIRHAVVSFSGEQRDERGETVRTAQFASRGEVVELEQEEFDRLLKHGAIYSEEQTDRLGASEIIENGVIYNPVSDPAGDANAPVGELNEMSDEDLQQLLSRKGTAEIVALAQGLEIDVIERVLRAENEVTEGNPRPTLLGPLVDSLGYNPLADDEGMDWRERRLGEQHSDAMQTGYMSGAGEGARVFTSLDNPSPNADDLDPTRVPGGSRPLAHDKLPVRPNASEGSEGGGEDGPTKAELQEEARARGLSTSGSKAEIQARLSQSD